MGEAEDLYRLFPEHITRTGNNFTRAEQLVAMHSLINELANRVAETTYPGADDILRSAVVFIHATLEDFLRNIAFDFLPREENGFVAKLPLAGKERSASYKMEDLLRHRGKTVDQVVDESINQWLNRHSFNKADQISALLRDLRLPTEPMECYFGELDKMIKRRHKIVHDADLPQREGATPDEITPETVKGWCRNTNDFAVCVLRQLKLLDNGTNNA